MSVLNLLPSVDSTPVEPAPLVTVSSPWEYDVPIAPITFDDYGWMDSAVCASTDPELFFASQKGEHPREARKICAVCPVRTECLEQALKVPAYDDYGMWGGTSAEDRIKIRRERRAASINLTLVENDSVSLSNDL